MNPRVVLSDFADPDDGCLLHAVFDAIEMKSMIVPTVLLVGVLGSRAQRCQERPRTDTAVRIRHVVRDPGVGKATFGPASHPRARDLVESVTLPVFGHVPPRDEVYCSPASQSQLLPVSTEEPPKSASVFPVIAEAVPQQPVELVARPVQLNA